MTHSTRTLAVFALLPVSAGRPAGGLPGSFVAAMIMLAAVAASGDVNVNAIAACAAVAVAGVGLAVPCLFGHNSLNTRVKELTQLGRVSCEIVK